MNEPARQRRWTRSARAALVVTALAGNAACNQISGADRVDFTLEPQTSSSSGTSESLPTDDSTSFYLQCDGGTPLQGVGVHAGSWLDAFYVKCTKRNPDGTATDYDSSPVGGMGGDSDRSPALCPPGQSVVTFKYRYNDATLAYQVAVQCAVPSVWASTGKISSESAFVGGIAPAVRERSLACPQGKVAAGIHGHATNYVNDFTSLDCVPRP